jgi:hypothetical protein
VYLIEKYEKRQGNGTFIASKDLPIDDGEMMEFQEEEKGDFSSRRMSNGSTQSGGVTLALSQAEKYIDEFF